MQHPVNPKAPSRDIDARVDLEPVESWLQYSPVWLTDGPVRPFGERVCIHSESDPKFNL